MIFAQALVVFVAGVLAGILLARQYLVYRQQNLADTVNAEYYKGLNYILNERPEEALQAFIQLVKVQPQTIEIHLAIGTLYRRRGQLDNAIRIHQNLLARHDLSARHQSLAMCELAQDYRLAGVFDRAEQLLKHVAQSGFYQELCYQGLLKIYTSEREWHAAIHAASKLAKISNSSQDVAIANFYAELAQAELFQNHYAQARKYLKQALKIERGNARIYWLIADIASAQNLPYRAARAYCLLLAHQPRYCVDVVPKIFALYAHLNVLQRVIIDKKLLRLFKQQPNILAAPLANKISAHQGALATREQLADILKSAPNLSLLQAWLGQYPLAAPSDQAQSYVKTILSTKPSHRCDQCGYLGYRLSWQCPSCHTWGAIFPISE